VDSCKPGDLIKITLKDFMRVSPQVLIGIVVETKLSLPHLSSDVLESPGPIYEIKILTTSGEIWESWVDQRDEIEILK